MKNLGFAFFMILMLSSQAFAQRKPVEELEKSRLAAKAREEGLMKARDVLKARIDRMRTRLEGQEKLLEDVNQRLDHTRQNLLEIEKSIQSRVDIN